MHVEWCELNFVNDHVQNTVEIVSDYIIAAVKKIRLILYLRGRVHL